MFYATISIEVLLCQSLEINYVLTSFPVLMYMYCLEIIWNEKWKAFIKIIFTWVSTLQNPMPYVGLIHSIFNRKFNVSIYQGVYVWVSHSGHVAYILLEFIKYVNTCNFNKHLNIEFKDQTISFVTFILNVLLLLYLIFWSVIRSF